MGAHPFSRAGETQIFLGGGLDIDLRGSDAAGRRDVLLHLRDKILELWPLRDDGGVNVGNRVALLAEQLHHMAQKLQAVRPGIARVGVREDP